MPLFSLQDGFCNVCGKEMKWDCNSFWKGRVCSSKCHDEHEWRRALSILGKPYKPQSNQSLESP